MALSPPYHPSPKATATQMPVDYEADDLEEDEAANEDEFYTGEEEEEPHYWLHGSTAAKFLLAGGVAGGGKIPVLIVQGCWLTSMTQYHERVPRRSIV